MHQDCLEGLLKQAAGPDFQSVWFSSPRVGPRQLALLGSQAAAAAVGDGDPHSENQCAKRYLLIF